MLRFARPFITPAFRAYSTGPPKTTIQLVAEIRKLTDAPIVKARQALNETGNDLQAALKWLEKDLLASGAAKATKIKDRSASEGVISVSIVDGGRGSRVGSGKGALHAAMIELNCETDFVARTDQFSAVAASIAQTASRSFASKSHGGFKVLDVEEFLTMPLVSSDDPSSTVQSAITDLVARTGENITLRRGTIINYAGSPSQPESALRLASYVHNASTAFPFQGRIAAFSLLHLNSSRLPKLFSDPSFFADVEKLERALARQIVGFSPSTIVPAPDSVEGDESALYDQQFITIGGDRSQQPVHQVLSNWKKQWGIDEIEVADFVKWQVGEQESLP